eukprot:scaffold22874_cov59-Cyclotella_meneghiniana.AAC.2
MRQVVNDTVNSGQMWIKLYMAWIFTSIGDTIAKVEMNSGYINEDETFRVPSLFNCDLLSTVAVN